MPKVKRDWNTFMNGAFAERLDEAFDEISANIQDPNYDPKAKRSIVIKIDFKSDAYREVADVEFTVNPKLPAKISVSSRLLFGRDSKGQAVWSELNSADPNQLELTISDEGVTEVQDNIALLQRV